MTDPITLVKRPLSPDPTSSSAIKTSMLCEFFWWRRYKYSPSLSLLRIEGMPTDLHEAIGIFLSRSIYQLEFGPQTCFSLPEVRQLDAKGTGIPFPGVMQTKRTKRPAYKKIPDFSIKYGERPFPNVVFEVGYAKLNVEEAKYQQSIHNARDWLVASKGKVKVVWIVHIVELPVSSTKYRVVVDELLRDEVFVVSPDGSASEEDTGARGLEDELPDDSTDSDHNVQDSSHSSDSSSPSNSFTASAYTRMYNSINHKNWVGPLTIFMEGYTFNTNTKDIQLTYLRSQLMQNNHPVKPLPTLPLAREHFNLPNHSHGTPNELHISFEDFLDRLDKARWEEAYARKTEACRERRLSKRKPRGDDPVGRGWSEDSQNDDKSNGEEDEEGDEVFRSNKKSKIVRVT